MAGASGRVITVVSPSVVAAYQASIAPARVAGVSCPLWGIFGIDVVGEFGERWNLASHYPV